MTNEHRNTRAAANEATPTIPGRHRAGMPDLDKVAASVRAVGDAVRGNVYWARPFDHDRRASAVADLLEHLATAAPDLLGRNHETEALLDCLDGAARGARNYADTVDRQRAEPEDSQDFYDHRY
jgi:hypothetical protein